MKILIVSDTHGSLENFDRVLEEVGKIDLLIHMGDVENDEDYIEAAVECPVHMVAGNNDFFTFLPEEKEIRIGKYNILLTHGHNYCVSVNTRMLKREGKERNMDIVMYGHTHKPDIDYEGDIIAINPGSLSYPRQEGRRPTYIIMEINKDGEANFTLEEL